MHQCILAAATVPPGYGLNILSIDKVDNKLIVVTRIKNRLKPGMMTIADDTYETDKIIIENGGEEKLDVIFFLTDVPKSEGDKHIGNYKNQARQLGPQTQFNPITDVNEISALLKGAERLYTYQGRRKRQSRLDDYATQKQRQQLPVLSPNAIPAAPLAIEKEKLASIINIHTTVSQDGLFKVIIEHIYQDVSASRRFTEEDVLAPSQNLSYFSGGRLHFDVDLCRMKDTQYKFKTTLNGETVWTHTSAVEYCLMNNLNVSDLCVIMEAFDRWVAQVKAEGMRNKFLNSYIQFSQHSILDYFKDHFVSELEKGYGYTISNAAPISIDTFVKLPGTHPVDERVSEHIVKALARNTNVKGYGRILDALYVGTSDAIDDPMERFEKTFDIPVRQLYKNISPAEKLALVTRLEKKLIDTDLTPHLYLLLRFNLNAILNLIQPAMGKRACDGGLYRITYTEFAALLSCDFMLGEDGRMRIKNGAGYNVHYAPGRRLHNQCAPEFGYLAKVLGLTFATDNNFHKEIIFTPESTQVLRSLGVHINPVNILAMRFKLSPPVQVRTSVAGMFAESGAESEVASLMQSASSTPRK